MFMINEWKHYLRERGFEKIGRREFLRASSPISSIICEAPLRIGDRQVKIDVAAEIDDPWITGRDYHVVDLAGVVTPEGIFVHYEPTAYWLNPEQQDAVFAVLRRCLAPWCEYWADPRHLVDYLEQPVDVIGIVPSAASRGWEQTAGSVVIPRRAPSVDYQLSLLYYHTGKHRKALECAKRYLEFLRPVPANTYEDEPGRTLRQIEVLSGLTGTAK